jgi:hypothetical protein
VVTAESLDLKNGADTCPAPEDVAGDDLAQVKSASHCPAPEGAAGDDPAQVGSANYDPAPEGAQAGSPSCTSMDVHAGSPPHSGCMVAALTLDQGVALEGSVPACWGLVLKCYELRTRQHKMLNVNVLRP